MLLGGATGGAAAAGSAASGCYQPSQGMGVGFPAAEGARLLGAVYLLADMEVG
jgi:hypothetical protein